MKWTIKEILIGIVEMVAILGLFAAYYGMIPGGSI